MLRKSLILLAICSLALIAYTHTNARKTPVVKAIQKCIPSVVNVGTEQIILLRQNPFWGRFGGQFDDAYSQFLSSQMPVVGTAQTQSVGSGVIVSADGLIVTNSHVVSMANKVIVTLNDGKPYPATLIGKDNENDIALIKIEPPSPLKPIDFSIEPIIGETVIAIGNPLGLQNSVSAGIVSGTKRTFTTTPATHAFTDLIQTDASINIGSSGGALINLEGKLLGINMATMQNAQGLSFAIPASKIQKMLDEYKKILAEKKKNQA